MPTGGIRTHYLNRPAAIEQRLRPRGHWDRPVLYLFPLKLHLHTAQIFLRINILDGLGDFSIGGQIIQTVKYADDLVLMAKEEKVLQGMIDKLIEIGSCCGMEMNVEKKK